MSHSVSTLLLRNLHDVFGEIDPARRRAAIDDIFHQDAVFYDPKGGIYRGRDEIDRIAGVIKARGRQPAKPMMARTSNSLPWSTLANCASISSAVLASRTSNFCPSADTS